MSVMYIICGLTDHVPSTIPLLSGVNSVTHDTVLCLYPCDLNIFQTFNRLSVKKKKKKKT